MPASPTAPEGGKPPQVIFVLVKPDGVARDLVDPILKEYKNRGFECLARVKFSGRERLAKRFRAHYAEHAEKSFFADLVREMSTSGPIVAAILRTKTTPIGGVAEAGRTICRYLRLCWAEGARHNTIHASDSSAAAAREIGIWFPPELPADLDL